MRNLFSLLYTREDALYLHNTLDQLAGNLFSVKNSFEASVMESFSMPIADAILKDMRDARVSTEDPSAIQSYIQTLSKEIQQLPVLTLRIAFEPTRDLVRNINTRFDANSQKLINVIIDPSVIGGATIEWQGKFLDYSVKKMLQEKLQPQQSASASAVRQ